VDCCARSNAQGCKPLFSGRPWPDQMAEHEGASGLEKRRPNAPSRGAMSPSPGLGTQAHPAAQEAMCCLPALPPELRREVLSYLDGTDAVALARTNKAMHANVAELGVLPAQRTALHLALASIGPLRRFHVDDPEQPYGYGPYDEAYEPAHARFIEMLEQHRAVFRRYPHLFALPYDLCAVHAGRIAALLAGTDHVVSLAYSAPERAGLLRSGAANLRSIRVWCLENSVDTNAAASAPKQRFDTTIAFSTWGPIPDPSLFSADVVTEVLRKMPCRRLVLDGMLTFARIPVEGVSELILINCLRVGELEGAPASPARFVGTYLDFCQIRADVKFTSYLLNTVQAIHQVEEISSFRLRNALRHIYRNAPSESRGEKMIEVLMHQTPSAKFVEEVTWSLSEDICKTLVFCTPQDLLKRPDRMFRLFADSSTLPLTLAHAPTSSPNRPRTYRADVV
jgi:hypothetical protein